MNRRPPALRTPAMPAATWSTTSRSIAWRISTLSATNPAVNSPMVLPRVLGPRRAATADGHRTSSGGVRVGDPARGERVEPELVAVAADLARLEADADEHGPQVAGIEVPLVVVHLLGGAEVQ